MTITGLTMTGWLGLALAWLSVGGLALQTARGGVILSAISFSEETAAAGRLAIRRGILFAAIYSVALVSADLFLPAFHAATAEVVVRCLMFAACPIVVFWAGAPLVRRGRNDGAREAAGGQSPTESPSKPSRPSKRVATLVARRHADFVPRAWWIAPGLLFLAPFVMLVGRSLSAAGWLGFGVGMCLAATFGLGWGIWARSTASPPQDLSRALDPEALDRACLAFRRFMARGVFLAMVGAVLVGSAVAVLAIVFDGDPRFGAIVGVAGGIGGSTIGVAGGILGALADRHRRAILELGGLPPEPRIGGSSAERSAG